MAEERKAEDVLRHVLPVQVGGETRELRVRTRRENREWIASLARAVTGAGGIAGMDLETLSSSESVLHAISDRIFDLVVEYDSAATLGGSDYLDEHATEGEVYAIFRKILDVAFPFARDLRTVLVELRAVGLADLLRSARSMPESSTNGSSESGGSVPLVSTTS